MLARKLSDCNSRLEFDSVQVLKQGNGWYEGQMFAVESDSRNMLAWLVWTCKDKMIVNHTVLGGHGHACWFSWTPCHVIINTNEMYSLVISWSCLLFGTSNDQSFTLTNSVKIEIFHVKHPCRKEWRNFEHDQVHIWRKWTITFVSCWFVLLLFFIFIISIIIYIIITTDRMYDGEIDVWSVLERLESAVRICADFWIFTIQCVADVVRHGRFREFGHFGHKSEDDWVLSFREMKVKCVGRDRKTWGECVKDDILFFFQWYVWGTWYVANV